MISQLQELRNACADADKALEDYLKATYPSGMRIGVRLKRGQVNPTWGIVYRCWSGNIQVHFPDARRPYRNIDPDDVMDPA